MLKCIINKLKIAYSFDKLGDFQVSLPSFR